MLTGAGCKQGQQSPGLKAQEKRTVRIVTFGNSITEGVRDGVNSTQTYTYYLGKILKEKGFQVEIIRKGVSGEDTRGALRRMEQDVIREKPGCVTIMYGTNDAFIDVQEDEADTTPRVPVERYEKNLQRMVQTLKQNNIKPLLMTSIPMGNFGLSHLGIYKTNGINFKLEEYVEAVRRVSIKEKIPLVDHFAGWIKWQERGHDIDAWMTDGMHPNPKGHRFIAAAIFNVLIKELNK